MKQIIHINKNIIASNRKHGKWEPAIIFRNGNKKVLYGYEIRIKDDNGKVVGRFIQDRKGLKCGARVYFEQLSGSVEITNGTGK